MGGSGYRHLGGPPIARSLKARKQWAMWTRTLLPFDLLVVRERNATESLFNKRGRLVDYLLAVMKPKDLKVIPSELFQMPGMGDMLEWTLFQGWG